MFLIVVVCLVAQRLYAPPASCLIHLLPNRRFESSKSGALEVAVDVSRAIAALRCLPCLVGSFATTEDARRGAVGRALGLIDELLTACSVPGVATVEGEGVADATAFDSLSSEKRHRKRRKSAGNSKDESEGVTSVRKCGGEQQAGVAMHGEVAVVRAYALEAGVGLCCLLPAAAVADGSREVGRLETLERLLGWHDR